MQYYPELPSRFVIIPRKSNHGDTGVMFVDTDPCHVSYILWSYMSKNVCNEMHNIGFDICPLNFKHLLPICSYKG